MMIFNASCRGNANLATCKVAETLCRKALSNNLLTFVYMRETYNMRNQSFLCNKSGRNLDKIKRSQLYNLIEIWSLKINYTEWMTYSCDGV